LSGFVKGYKYEVDTSFFEHPLSKEAAYVLGFIWADGSVKYYKRDDKITSAEFQIEIKEEDEYVLEMIRKVMSSNHRIAHRQRKACRLSRFQVVRKDLVIKLLKYGIEEKKSFKNISPKHIDSEVEGHFIRGLFDGDGSVSFVNNRARFNIGGSINTISWVRDCLCKNGLPYHKVSLDKRSLNFGIIEWQGRDCLEKVYKYLYNEANALYMERKHKVFKEILH